MKKVEQNEGAVIYIAKNSPPHDIFEQGASKKSS